MGIIFFIGNSNLVYTIIRKRHVFHALANLPSDVQGISKCLNNRKIGIAPQQPVHRVKTPQPTSPTVEKKTFSEDESTIIVKSPLPEPEVVNGSTLEDKGDVDVEESMEGSRPALPAEPGTLKASLLETPPIATMTERESAHLLQAPLCDFSPMNEHCDNTTVQDIQDVPITKLTLDENTESEPETVLPLKRTVNQVAINCFFFGTNENNNSIPFVSCEIARQHSSINEFG